MGKKNEKFIIVPLSDKDTISKLIKLGFNKISDNGSCAYFMNNKNLPSAFNKEKLFFTNVFSF